MYKGCAQGYPQAVDNLVDTFLYSQRIVDDCREYVTRKIAGRAMSKLVVHKCRGSEKFVQKLC